MMLATKPLPTSGIMQMSGSGCAYSSRPESIADSHSGGGASPSFTKRSSRSAGGKSCAPAG